MYFLNKLFAIFAVLLLPLAVANADECEPPCFYNDCVVACPALWRVEVRSAYFLPISSLEREIYSGARFDGELEVARSIFDNWDVWANVTYFNKSGRSDGFNERTTLQLVPVSLGLQYTYLVLCSLSLYAGLGINYTWMHLHNHTPIKEHREVNRSRVGCTCKTGAYYDITDLIFVDIFADYLYIPMSMKNVDDVGGFRFGLGLGVRI